jgi:tetratricopeptide (TPR) repeat protein
MKCFFIAAIMALIATNVCAQTAEINRADSLYRLRYDAGNLKKAITILDTQLSSRPADYGVLWRLARNWWFLGDDETIKPSKLATFEKGKAYGEAAIVANPKGVDGHFWYAALIGSVGQEKGVLNSLFMVAPMKKELDACLSINNNYADAHDVLARLLWKVPGPPLSIGDRDRAQVEAEIGTRLAPNAIDHWLHLGQIAASNNDDATARAALSKALEIPDDPEDPPSSQRHKAVAKAELEKLETK